MNGAGSRALGPRTGRVLAAIGAVGTALFAALHVYWAAGGRVGVPPAVGEIADRTWFLVYDLAAAAVFVAAALVGVVLACGVGGFRLRAALMTVTLWGSVLALARGLVGVVQATVTVVTGQGLRVGAVYDVWFVVAGVVFLVAAGAFVRVPEPPR